MTKLGWAQPVLKGWREHLPNHGELLAPAEEAVVATPEGARQAKALLEPGSSNKGQAIHLAEQFGPFGRQAAPDRQLPLLQVGVGLALIPPALCPGQGFVAAAQPHLASQQGTIELHDFRGRWRAGTGAGWLRRHGDQLDLHRLARERLQVPGGAAVTQ